MRGFLKSVGAGVCAAALLIAGAQPAMAQQASDVIGSWSCNPQSATNTTNVTTTYMPDGTFVSIGQLHDTSGADVALAMFGRGYWSLVGNQLTEQATEFRLVWARIDGAPVIPETPIWNAMVDAMNGTMSTANVRTIEAVTATSLSVDFQGIDLTCTRP